MVMHSAFLLGLSVQLYHTGFRHLKLSKLIFQGTWVVLHYTDRIDRSTSPAGNDCLEPHSRTSCVTGWTWPYRVKDFSGMPARRLFSRNTVSRPVSILPTRWSILCQFFFKSISQNRAPHGAVEKIHDTVYVNATNLAACTASGHKTVNSSPRCLTENTIPAV